MIRAAVLFLLALLLSLTAAAQWDISISVFPVTCPGGADGSATVNVTGNQGPYTFQWNDEDQQATSTAVNLTADTFEVVITDGPGNDTLVTVMIPGPDEIGFHTEIKPAICNAATGRIKLDISGGNPPYDYHWAGINTSSSVASDLSQGSYHVVVIDDKGCEADTSIIVPEGECVVKGESVFTPNGDGINDTWAISNIVYFPNSRVIVYNRWGQVVHEQEGNYEPWDGTHWGQPVPDASYFYVIYKDVEDKENVSTGSVTIIR